MLLQALDLTSNRLRSLDTRLLALAGWYFAQFNALSPHTRLDPARHFIFL